MFLSFIAIPLPDAVPVKPHYIVMVIYYWAIYRPTLYPPAAAFFIGLMIDFIGGAVPGTHAILLILVQWIVREQRRFFMAQSFVTKWILFLAVLIIYAGLLWMISAIAAGSWHLNILAIVLDVAVSWLLFPLVTMLLILTHRFLPEVGRP